MLAAPDLGPLELLIFMVLALPASQLGLIFVGLCSLAGAGTDVTLSKGRHAMAAAAGFFFGLIVVLGFALPAFAFAQGGMPQLLFSWSILLAYGLGLLFLILMAALAGYQAARFLAWRFAWYRCSDCGAPFFSRFPAKKCAICAAKPVASSGHKIGSTEIQSLDGPVALR